MHQQRIRLSPAWAFSLAAVVFLAGLGSYGLVEQSDARYAEIAREMWRSGDYVVPTLLGIKHFHKPPLIYWLTVPGYALLGQNEWGARMFLAVAGLLLTGGVYGFARRHLPAVAPWSVLMLAATPAVIGGSRMLTIDLLLTLCLTSALLAWYSFRTGSGGPGSLVVLYSSIGLAFLAKGPVGWLLLLLVLVPAAWLTRGATARPARSWGLVWGLPLALAIALPWYIVVMIRTPGLTGYFLGQQLAGRLREGGMGHPHPWYYFLGVYPGLGLPWILLAPAGWRVVRRRDPSLATFLGLWATIPPIFFSLPATKLPLYTLPAYPAIVLLAIAALEEPRAVRRPLLLAGGVFLLLGLALAAVGAGAIPVAARDLAHLSARSLGLLAVPSAFALIVAGVTALASAGGRPHRACLSLFLGLAFLVAWTFTNTAAPFNSTKTVGLAVAREYRPGDTLVIFRTAAQGLPFYTGPAPSPLLVGVTRETGFEEPGKAPPLLEEPLFRTLLAGPVRVLVVTQERRRAELPQLREIARGSGYLLLGNR
jgi:4-amino-4-deoxy-L-arabinose transferase-like glycosyltransferase